MLEAQGDSRSPPRPKRYAAFISYSHRDRKWAEWLHRAIENYRIPEGLSNSAQADGLAAAALRPVFLDRSELPSSSDLAASIRTALEESVFLIVICSPDAARSRWVNEEIRTFKSMGRDVRILCLIVAGNPSSSATDASRPDECFPAALRFKVDDGQVTNLSAPEPLAADVRPGKDDRQSARLKIIAGLLGVSFDRLRQREQTRRQRRLAIIATASVVGCIAFGVLAAAALVARNEANRQRIVADQQSLTARRTADFLKSLFIVSNPSEARGNSVTAREVLDRGVRQVGEQLKDEPLVRADLTTTLGDVYTNLGLLKEAEDLLKEARSVPSQPKEISARELLSLGEVQYQRGENDAALGSLQEALALVEQSSIRDPLVRAKVDCALGDLYVSTQDYEKARLLFRQALVVASGSSPAEREIVAHSLESIAQTDFYDNHLDKAATEFKTALTARIALSGDLHPAAIEITDALGSVEYMRGHLAAAGEYYRTTLSTERRVLGEHDPEIGTTLNNLGRVLLEQRKFAEARPMLQEALSMQLSQRVETDAKALVFIFANLGLTEAELGNLADAEPLFQKGLSAAIANKHRLHGPILTDLADLECRTGRVDQGLARLETARPLVIESYPEDPWRVAHVDNVRAGCLTAAKRYADAARLFEASDPIVLKKWPQGTLYGYDALQRTLHLYSIMGNTAKVSEYRRLADKK
jgi:tetratricopeptide (TPR) repeat protein